MPQSIQHNSKYYLDSSLSLFFIVYFALASFARADNLQQILDESLPAYPTGVWSTYQAEPTFTPITPFEEVFPDIKNTKSRLADRNSLNVLIPSILKKPAETTLLDLPYALIARQEYSDDVKILGPITRTHVMGVVFLQSFPNLYRKFNSVPLNISYNTPYLKQVKKYYLSILHFEDFLHQKIPPRRQLQKNEKMADGHLDQDHTMYLLT
ncbi:MAG: hypothetical protein DSY58_04420 [Desulfobulbus sp.]|nr:MAG: hypothetical protein DSY58_04420 [Desulfobulbus sp.]